MFQTRTAACELQSHAGAQVSAAISIKLEFPFWLYHSNSPYRPNGLPLQGFFGGSGGAFLTIGGADPGFRTRFNPPRTTAYTARKGGYMENRNYGKIRELVARIGDNLMRPVQGAALVSVVNAIGALFELEAICASIGDVDESISLAERLGHELSKLVGKDRTEQHLTFLKVNDEKLRKLAGAIGRMGNIGDLKNRVGTIRDASLKIRQGEELPGTLGTIDPDNTKPRLDALREFCELLATIDFKSLNALEGYEQVR